MPLAHATQRFRSLLKPTWPAGQASHAGARVLFVARNSPEAQGVVLTETCVAEPEMEPSTVEHVNDAVAPF